MNKTHQDQAGTLPQYSKYSASRLRDHKGYDRKTEEVVPERAKIDDELLEELENIPDASEGLEFVGAKSFPSKTKLPSPTQDPAGAGRKVLVTCVVLSTVACIVVPLYYSGFATASENIAAGAPASKTTFNYEPQQAAPTVRGEEFQAPAGRVFRGDPIGGLLDNILVGDYMSFADVATGRCLRHMSEGEVLGSLRDIDTTTLKKLRDGRGWVMAQASLEVWDQFEHRWRKNVVTLRFTYVDERWKIEHLDVRPS